MSTLEKTQIALRHYMHGRVDTSIDVRAQLIVALVYDVVVLTVPLTRLDTLLWLLCYPIIMSEAFGVGYGRIFCRSLWVLPLIVLIGIFNPLMDHAVVCRVWGVEVTRGWLSFGGVVLRGLLSVQALLLLVATSGFTGMCRALSGIGVPDVLVTQLMMLFRYLSVLLDEALTMDRSRRARGFGRKSYPLRLWGVFVGQLLIRSLRRSGRVNRAMTARGFTGTLPFARCEHRPGAADVAYVVGWVAVIILLRVANISALLERFI